MNKSEFGSIQDAKIEIAKLQEEISSQAEVIAGQKESIATVLEDNNKLLVEIALLKDTITDLNEKERKLKDQLEKLNSEKIKMASIVTELRDENKALKDGFYATSGFLWTEDDDDTTTEDSSTVSVTYSGSFPDTSADRFPEEDDTEGRYLEGYIRTTDPSEVSNYHAPQFNFTGPVIIGGNKDIISDALDRYYTHLNGGYEPTDECSL